MYKKKISNDANSGFIEFWSRLKIFLERVKNLEKKKTSHANFKSFGSIYDKLYNVRITYHMKYRMLFIKLVFNYFITIQY